MSNKTLAAAAKTAWAHKKELLIVVACFIFVAGLVFLVGNPQEKPRLSFGGRQFDYETANTDLAREQGLSGRTDMPLNHAMLFVFPEAGQTCFWMKDMHFTLDIIWLNDQKRVVYMKKDATPESYPEQFCPDSLARYVIEVNAGVAKQTELKQGDQVQF